jgi:hypothetical protein
MSCAAAQAGTWILRERMEDTREQELGVLLLVLASELD